MNHTIRQVQPVCCVGMFGPWNHAAFPEVKLWIFVLCRPSALSSSGYCSALGASRSRKFRHSHGVCTKYANQVGGLTAINSPKGRCLLSAVFEERKCSRERGEASEIWMVLSTEEMNNSIWNYFITKKSCHYKNDILKIQTTLFKKWWRTILSFQMCTT